jgi:hypothetical protein
MDAFIQRCEAELARQQGVLKGTEGKTFGCWADDGRGLIDCTTERKQQVETKIAELEWLLRRARAIA